MKTSTLALSAALVLSLGYAAFLQVENRRLSERLAASRIDAAPLEAAPASDDAQAANSAAAAATESTGDPSAAPVDAAPALAGSSERQPSRDERRRDRMQRMTAAFDDPEMRVDMIERQMNQIDDRYAGFFKTVNLSSAEIDTLKALMAQRGVIGWEARMKGFAAESDEARAKIASNADQERAALEAEIAALLGPQEAARLQDYTESLPYRQEVEQLATRLSYTDAPLTDAQSELLVQQMQTVASDFRYTKDLSQMQRGGASDLTADDVATYFAEREQRDAQIAAAAAAALTEAQLAAFAERQIAEREREERRLTFMLENGFPARGGGPVRGFRGGEGP